MSKDIEKSKHPIIVTLLTLAALAGVIRLILKVINGDTSDNSWEK